MKKFLRLFILISASFLFFACTDDYSTYRLEDFEITLYDSNRECSVSEGVTVKVTGKLSHKFYSGDVSVYVREPNTRENLEFTLTPADESSFTTGSEDDGKENVYTSVIKDEEFRRVSRNFSVKFPEAGEYWLIVEVNAEYDDPVILPQRKIFPISVVSDESGE